MLDEARQRCKCYVALYWSILAFVPWWGMSGRTAARQAEVHCRGALADATGACRQRQPASKMAEEMLLMAAWVPSPSLCLSFVRWLVVAPPSQGREQGLCQLKKRTGNTRGGVGELSGKKKPCCGRGCSFLVRSTPLPAPPAAVAACEPSLRRPASASGVGRARESGVSCAVVLSIDGKRVRVG